ncbi:MAG: cation-translocating P-type ATPase [Bacteroidales bacterium]|nr:cation-translocating P-type ATPase [Bacteroidales bacterium]
MGKNTDFSDHNFVGLTEDQVKERQLKNGFNELPKVKSGGFFQQIAGIFKEPMFMLLIICGTLYMVLGDTQEGFMLLGFVFFIMGIEFYQERKTGKALEALKELSTPNALVIRNGEESKISCRELVEGDLVIFSEGERVPADGIILHSINLQVDESLLTGESVPVRKIESDGTEKNAVAGGDDTPFVFSGTMVIQGNGVAQVTKTGAETEIGKIGKALGDTKEEDTHLKIELNSLVKKLTFIGAFLCLMIVVVYFLTRGSLLNGFLAGLTLAMAVIPEEFPVILTVFMALGAWRISKKRVLTRKSSAIETLGSATVLCSDKTGTLTQNKMAVSTLYNKSTFFDVSKKNGFPEEFHEIIEYGILSSQTSPNDPMEKAICNIGEEYLQNTEHMHHDWSMVREYPLTREQMAMSRVYVEGNGASDLYTIAAKGAPETIFDLCHLSDTSQYEAAIQEMATNGLRVLGVAKATIKKESLPDIQHGFEFEFIGLIGLSDPIRPEVKDAVQECYKAGIRVIMITGDYPVTAQNIGKKIGLKQYDQCMTGPEVASMSVEELSKRIGQINIFARVVPEQKLKIVNALKLNGEIVAMTGDGVNDAPALKAAHIGIAMGERGTDVAREASELILTDDNFSSIVGAIRLGRRIFDNLQKAFGYVFAIHVPIAGLSMIPIFFADAPLLLFPMHVAFLELIIDPACSVIFESEKEEKNVMNRPPRGSKGKFFGGGKIVMTCMQGVSILLVVLTVYFIALSLGCSEEEVRTMSFITLIISNLMTIQTNRSWESNIFRIFATPNQSFKWIVSLALLLLTTVITIPFLRGLFSFALLGTSEIVISAAAGLLTIVWFEIYKAMKSRQRAQKDA